MCDCSGTLNFTNEFGNVFVTANICPFCGLSGSTVTFESKVEESAFTFSSDFVCKPSCIFSDDQALLGTSGQGTATTLAGDSFPLIFTLELVHTTAGDTFNIFLISFDFIILFFGIPVVAPNELTITDCNSTSIQTSTNTSLTKNNIANGFSPTRKIFINGKWQDL